MLKNQFVSLIQEKVRTQKKIDIFGKNSLLTSVLPYYLLPAMVLLLITDTITNPYYFIFLVYGLIPLMDEFFQLDKRNPSETERQELLDRDYIFKIPLYVTMILDWLLFFKTMHLFSTTEISFNNAIYLFGHAFLFSNINGIQFAVAHEILHKPGIHRILGTLHLSKNLYMHFTYEHMYGHHRKVSTPDDPATSIKGQNLYSFFIKSIFGSYKSCYQIEKKAGKSFLLNYSVLSVVASIVFLAICYYFYGAQATIMLFFCQVGAITTLEAINYIEHYGLMRNRLPSGEYEKVTIRHSWNAPHRFSNYLIYKLQRHSDHHSNCMKPYQTLVSLEESPHLPHGYSLMIFVSFFPKRWFQIMDPLVDEYMRVENGKIQASTMVKAVNEARKQMIQLALGTGIIWIMSMFVI